MRATGFKVQRSNGYPLSAVYLAAFRRTGALRRIHREEAAKEMGFL